MTYLFLYDIILSQNIVVLLNFDMTINRTLTKKIIKKITMKKTFFFLLLGLLYFNHNLQAQAMRVANETKTLLIINNISIGSGVSAHIELPVSNGNTTFEAYYYEGQNKKGPVAMTRMVRNNQIIIRSLAPTEPGYRSKTTVATEPVDAEETTANSQYTSSSDWWASVNVTPINMLEKYSIFVPADPFKGLALKPGQKSAKSITLQTGEILFPVFLAMDDMSGETATGINFSWALVNKIVTEGQETFEFLPQDIMKANNGRIVKKVLISRLPFDFIISEGASQGTVIPSNSPSRLELFVGWNIIPIQYKDDYGLPTQAILVLLVNDLRKPIMARGRTKSDQIMIKKENIVITNYAR